MDLDPPIHFDADPDPIFHFDADADPDPASCQKRWVFPTTGVQTLQGSIIEPPRLLCERPRPSMAPFLLIRILIRLWTSIRRSESGLSLPEMMQIRIRNTKWVPVPVLLYSVPYTVCYLCVAGILIFDTHTLPTYTLIMSKYTYNTKST